jgi:hypothetical protein
MCRKQLISFLKQSNQGVWVVLMPGAIITNSDVTAVELECVMHAEKDLLDFLLGPMKKGGEAKMRMVAVYHLTQDRISRASIYWGRRVE